MKCRSRGQTSKFVRCQQILQSSMVYGGGIYEYWTAEKYGFAQIVERHGELCSTDVEGLECTTMCIQKGSLRLWHATLCAVYALRLCTMPPSKASRLQRSWPLQADIKNRLAMGLSSSFPTIRVVVTAGPPQAPWNVFANSASTFSITFIVDKPRHTSLESAE